MAGTKKYGDMIIGDRIHEFDDIFTITSKHYVGHKSVHLTLMLGDSVTKHITRRITTAGMIV
jgi:hypothetical protein